MPFLNYVNPKAFVGGKKGYGPKGCLLLECSNKGALLLQPLPALVFL